MSFIEKPDLLAPAVSARNGLAAARAMPAGLPPLLLVDVRTGREARSQPVAFAHVRVPIVDYPGWDAGDDRGRDFARLAENPAFVTAVAQALADAGMGRGDAVVLFCPTARRARRATRRLRQAGFPRPYALSLAAVRMVWGHPEDAAVARALVHAL